MEESRLRAQITETFRDVLNSPNLELKDELTALGMPASSVRFIHEVKDDAAKAALFWACRNGAVSVLVFSIMSHAAAT